MKNRVSEEDIIQKCMDQNFTYISRYIKNKSTRIKYICNLHQEKGIQDTSWTALLKKKNGCSYCSKKKRTANDFFEYMKNNHKNIEIIDGDYKNRNSRFICKCLIDNNIWETSAESLLSGHGCIECYKKRTSSARMISHDEFLKHVYRINPDIEILSLYNGTKNKINCKCKKCEHQWCTIAESLYLQNTGCPICARKKAASKIRITYKEFIKRLNKTNKDVEIVGKYEKITSKIRLRCLVHNVEYEQTGTEAITEKNGCPFCNNISIGENKIANMLDDMNIKYIRQYRNDNCKDLRTLPFDFYLPSKNICIEYDGEQHYRPVDRFGGKNAFELIKKHDKIKNTFCKNNGIKLIRIPYWEKENIKELLCNKIL